MNNSSQILYALECGHAAPGPPTLVNGTLVCAWCQDHFPIIGVIVYEWCANCLDCRFKRFAGLSKHNAEIFANGHANKPPRTHKVRVEYTRNPAALATSQKMIKWRLNDNRPTPIRKNR